MQRKTFRIEAMLSRARTPLASKAVAQSQPNSADVARLERELATVYEAIDKSRGEIAALIDRAGEVSRLARAGQELMGAVGGMEKATEKILKEAEGADEGARALVATLQDDYKRGVAQDIQDHVTRIYESCNFQDLAGQRITKAVATLRFIEERVAALSVHWGGIDQLRRLHGKPSGPGSLVNGPRLEGDSGHATQRDIDKMFA